MEKYYCILCLITMVSCHSIKYVDYSKIIEPQQIEEDITYLKNKLKDFHYDLNWENREKELMSMLDKVSINNQKYTSEDFKLALAKVLQTIDDGHTSVFGKALSEKVARRQYKKKQNFVISPLDSITIYLRVPSFTDQSQLQHTLKSLKKYRRINNFKGQLS